MHRILHKLKQNDNLPYIVVAGVMTLVIILGVWFFKNYSEEVIHTSGVVIDQVHHHWITQQPVTDSNGKITHYRSVYHDSWKTKIKTYDGNAFTDNSKSAYEDYYKGQTVAVDKVLCYFKGKYLFTYYRIAR